MTGLDQVDGRSVLRMERRIAHPVERVWRAITEPAGLAAWFPSPVTIELRPGGRVDYGDGPDGAVTALDPPRLIAFTWDTDHLRFELEPDGDATLLRLVHTFDDHGGAASFAAGWHACLDGLGALLDGDTVVDPGAFDHAATHEHYFAEFGLDEPVVTDGPDGWQVQVQRQLVRPVEEVAPKLPADGDGVRWELGEGTGHGARLVVTWSGGDAAACEAARADLLRRVRELVAALA